MIKVQHLNIQSRRRHPILNDINLDLSSNTLHVIVGPNGSGKTTLLRSMIGLMPASSGTISLMGTDISTLKPIEIASKISYVESEHSSHFNYTVEDIIIWGRWWKHQGFPSREDRQTVHKIAAELKIESFLRRSITSLSLGERKKVHLARSIASDSPILVWDEPFAPLDIRATLEMIQLSQRIVLEGRQMILTLHDLSLAWKFADEITILCEGSVRYSGIARTDKCLEALTSTFGVKISLASQQSLDISLPQFNF